MKNRKLFTVTAVIIMLVALAAPVFTETFCDRDNGAVFASAWTFWDDEQFETSMPYLDVWTAVMNINSTYDIDLVRTVVDRAYYISEYAVFYNSGFGTSKDILAPVAAFEADQFSARVTQIIFSLD